MAKLTSRSGMLVFTGAVDVFFGLAFILLGKDSVLIFPHGAVGVPMWTGIGIVLIGIGNIISVLTASKKKRNTQFFDINCSSLVLNLVGLILAACLIGFYIWGAWSVLEQGSLTTNVPGSSTVTHEDAILIFTAVIIMAMLVFIISLMAMFMDCCSYALFTGGPGVGDYGSPRPPRGSMYDSPYGMPPPHMYKQ
ncbi:uncharacterized protein LOC119725821 [Patiria miniata]|uniref:Uncharacterized protein n=1 Tax=Patiria miniata TaxID=46514 RepID=A0A913ZQD2_PATMI|nr:uncharacterized protein LOC119725821 [Patiria miniata]